MILNTCKRLVSANASNSGGSKPAKDMGVCPKCGKPIKTSDKFFMCSDYKNPCEFIVGKTIMGAKITDADFKKLLKGETIKKKFTWKSGKQSEAGLKLVNGKTEFVFN